MRNVTEYYNMSYYMTYLEGYGCCRFKVLYFKYHH